MKKIVDQLEEILEFGGWRNEERYYMFGFCGIIPYCKYL